MDIVHWLERGQSEKAAGVIARHLHVARERAVARIHVIVSGRPDDLPYLERLESLSH
jgi:hypothetical protein